MTAVDTRPGPRRWWTLGALVASMLVLGFDLTILNVARSAMAEQLDAGTGELQWIVDSYIVVFAALMLPAGLLGDRFGRRRMLVAGLPVFLAGALFGTLVSTPELVIAARTVMGVGAALVIPLTRSPSGSTARPRPFRRRRVRGRHGHGPGGVRHRCGRDRPADGGLLRNVRPAKAEGTAEGEAVMARTESDGGQ